ncbi:MAG: lysophospholipid acyltransferase family protein [Kiritimatiellae bacterium]|nr:lysophospholipid acyltransferase family protein [Kiritimatiellia bacterium]
MKNEEVNPFRLDPAKIDNPGLRFWVRLFRGLLERIFRFPALNRYYAASRTMDGSRCFSSRVLAAMGVTWREGRGGAADPASCPLPAEGPVVVVANHPFGGIEGVIMLAMMEHWRSDAKVLVNFMLSVIPDLRKDFLFVNPFGGTAAKRENMASMKAGLKWLSEGHVLVVFPAGEVSSYDRRTGLVRDIQWSDTITRMIRKTGATVVPIFFGGDNGRFFNFMGRIHPRLRTLLLPQEFVNKAGREIRVEIGDPISPREMAPYTTDDALTSFLRLRTYVLAERVQIINVKLKMENGGEAGGTAAGVRQAEIIPPVPPEDLAAEIAALPPEARACEGDGLEVYFARASQIPKCLRELGRLREITYREVGEGTNTEIDLDKYDDYYLHLFLWNPEKREIAGAYRLGLADEIMAEKGVEGLYTHTCFDYDKPFVDAISPAIELGRSFVRKEYQRAFSSLMLLWKGICIYLATHRKYECLFGPVSISNDYLDASKEIIMRSMRLSCGATKLVALAKPYLAPKPLKPREWLLPEYDAIFADQEAAAKIVQEIEPEGRSIPILVKQYSKMGGRVVCFNVDPAFNFCIDGLVAIRMAEADERIMRRYMGAENYAAYLEGREPHVEL